MPSCCASTAGPAASPRSSRGLGPTRPQEKRQKLVQAPRASGRDTTRAPPSHPTLTRLSTAASTPAAAGAGSPTRKSTARLHVPCGGAAHAARSGGPPKGGREPLGRSQAVLPAREGVLTMGIARSAEEAEKAFWKRVDKGRGPWGCWYWLGPCRGFGYGSVYWHGRTVAAHRVAWELVHGKAPRLQLLHWCDEPKCVNPAHLREGTQAENVADMCAKGRNVKKTVCIRGHSIARPEERNTVGACRLCARYNSRQAQRRAKRVPQLVAAALRLGLERRP